MSSEQADSDQRTDFLGNPIPEPEKDWIYVDALEGSYQGRTAYTTRHEAAGAVAILNRRNPDVEFSVVAIEAYGDHVDSTGD